MVTTLRPSFKNLAALWPNPELEPMQAFRHFAISGMDRRLAGARSAAILAVHTAVWTLLPTLLLLRTCRSIWSRRWCTGGEWQLGYDTLPSLPWWLVRINRLTCRSDHDCALSAGVRSLKVSSALVLSSTWQAAGVCSRCAGFWS